jgi:hypothetical protein
LATTAPAFSNWSTDVLPGAAGTDSTDRYVRHPILAGKVTVRKRRTSNRNDVSLRQFRKAVLVADRMCGTPFVLFVNVVVGVSPEPQVPRIATRRVIAAVEHFKWTGINLVDQPVHQSRSDEQFSVATAYSQAAVTAALAASPRPTLCLATGINFRP